MYVIVEAQIMKLGLLERTVTRKHGKAEQLGKSFWGIYHAEQDDGWMHLTFESYQLTD